MSSGAWLRRALNSLDRLAGWAPAAVKPAPHMATGRRGEEEAYFYLRKLGYVVVARNYRSARRRGELDMVAWDAETLCFIEVKSRSTRAVAPAEAAVDFEKQRELGGMARDYLRRVNTAPPIRLDVVSVYLEAGHPPEINLFKNAFPLS